VGKAADSTVEREMHSSELEAVYRMTKAVISAKSEQEALDSVCKLVVETKLAKFAWAGRPDELSKLVIPIAKAGADKGYLSKVKVAFDSSDLGCGPTGKAFRTGKPNLVRFIETDECYKPWRDEALARGFRSSVAIPIVLGKDVFGSLTVYSETPDAYSTDTVSLFEEFASNLALTLRNFRDKEAREKAEKELRVSEEKFRSLVENTQDVIISVNMLGKITYISPQFSLYGVRSEDVLNKNFIDFIYPDDRAGLLADFAKAMVGIKTTSQFRVVTPNGKVIWFEEKDNFQRDKSGRVMGITAILRDATERKKIEEERAGRQAELEKKVTERTAALKQEVEKVELLSKARDEFVRNITHELKTPLSVILLDTELARRAHARGKEAEFNEFMDTVDRNAVRLRGSIENVLELSRVGTMTEYKKEKVSVEKLIESVIDVYGPIAQKKGVALEVKGGNEPLVILGDPSLLPYVLTNLVSNAIKFTSEGSVAITAERKEKFISISVSDSGIGMSEETQRRMFEKFFKADPSAPGTGVGLTIVKEIAEGHGGRIEFKSKLGKGTTFTIFLPAG